MLFQNTYKMNKIAADFEQKLSLYEDSYNKKQEYSFKDECLKELVFIIIGISNSDLTCEIKAFNKKYKVELELNNNSLQYPWDDISDLSSELYSTLFTQSKDKVFVKFLDIIKNKLPGNCYYDWFSLSFEDDEIKNHFLDKATEYIIKNQISPNQWIENFKNIDYKKYSWLNDFKISDIPKSFKNLNEIFYWFKKNGNQEYLHFIGSSLIDSLLLNVIRIEESNQYFIFNENKNYVRINKILKECRNDYTIVGNILTSKNLKLDTYFLTKKEFAIYGFLNLYDLDSAPSYDITDDNEDYVNQWNEMLSSQLVNVFFEHFKYAQNKDDFSEPLYNLLNYLASEHLGRHSNQHKYKEISTLKKVLTKISTTEILTSEHEKKYLFDLIANDVVTKQLDNITLQNECNGIDYFLLSWYLEQIDIKQRVTDNNYSNLICNITVAISHNIKKNIDIATNKDKFYLDNVILEKVNFGLFFTHSKVKDEWLNLLDILKIKEQLNSTDIYMPLYISEFYVKILLKIYKDTEDSIVAKYLNKLAIKIGIEEKHGIFSNLQNNGLLNEFIEVLNSFNDTLFRDFTYALYKKKNIKHLLQLYTYTFIETRRVKIKKELDKITEDLNDESFLYIKDLEDTMMYASTHLEFKKLNNDLLKIYINNTTKRGHPSRKKEYAETICKRELLDIYYDETLSRDKKHIELNNYTKKIKEINDKNYGTESIQVKCENYQSFIHAIVWFEEDAFKTYQILRKLCDKEVNSLYLINMTSAYFRTYKDDENKIEKYKFALKEYENYYKKLNNPIKSLFDYQILIYGYTQTKNTIKLLELDNEIPKNYVPHIKEELPKEISFFNSTIIIKNKIVICVEGTYDIKFLMNINQYVEEFKQIIDIKKESISIIPLRGNNLTQWIEQHHLEGSNIIEIHIFDSDLNSGRNTFKYEKDCKKVNDRDDKSVGFLTNKREMENYIHKSLIENEFDIDMSFIDKWDIEDIPTYIKNKSKVQDENKIKGILNGKLSKRITRELLEDIDGFDEIKNWFEKIKELSNL